MSLIPGQRDPRTRSAFPVESEGAGQFNSETHTDIHTDIDNRLVYRLLLAIDVQGYSRRDAREQLRTQQDLNALLDIAAEHSGLDRGRWEKQVGGDGEMAVLPEDVDVLRVVEHFTRSLAGALVRLNRGRRAGGPVARPRLRVRLAFHHGTLTSGPFGPAGDAPIVVSRLLDARALRRLLAEQPDRDLAFIVSDSLFRDVIGTGFCGLERTGFRQVRLMSKGLSHKGYIYVPQSMTAVADEPVVPAEPAEPAATATAAVPAEPSPLYAGQGYVGGAEMEEAVALHGAMGHEAKLLSFPSAS